MTNEPTYRITPSKHKNKVSLDKVDNINEKNMMLQEQINVIEEKFKMKNKENKIFHKRGQEYDQIRNKNLI